MFADNFLLISSRVLVLFILIAIGFLCGKKQLITEHASKKMTDLVLYVVTPCVMISAFQRKFSFDLLFKAGAAAAARPNLTKRLRCI